MAQKEKQGMFVKKSYGAWVDGQSTTVMGIDQ